jgi:hypothetical protein
MSRISDPPTKLQTVEGKQMSLTAYRSKRAFAKHPNQPGECGEVAAAETLSFKSTMPVGFIMIFG